MVVADGREGVALLLERREAEIVREQTRGAGNIARRQPDLADGEDIARSEGASGGIGQIVARDEFQDVAGGIVERDLLGVSGLRGEIVNTIPGEQGNPGG